MRWFDESTLFLRFGPDWERWLAMPYYTIPEAAALSVGIDPNMVSELKTGGMKRVDPRDAIDAWDLVRERTELLKRWANVLESDGGLADDPFHQAQIVMSSKIASLLVRLNLDVPDELRRLSVDASPSTARRWPWGDYTTDLLEHLAAAGERWGPKFYDPSDPTTAPTNAQIEELLERRGLQSKSMREKMASILRDPSIKTGPR